MHICLEILEEVGLVVLHLGQVLNGLLEDVERVLHAEQVVQVEWEIEFQINS